MKYVLVVKDIIAQGTIYAVYGPFDSVEAATIWELKSIETARVLTSVEELKVPE